MCVGGGGGGGGAINFCILHLEDNITLTFLYDSMETEIAFFEW